MREGFSGTIESEGGAGRRERFVALARFAVGILESISRRTQPIVEPVAPKASVDARLVPLLDLSPGELGSPKIATYCADHGIEFSNQALSFRLFDGKRAEMSIGPSLETANFFFKNEDKNMLVVFSRLDGGYQSLSFVDGIFDGLYDSDEIGKPVPFQSFV